VNEVGAVVAALLIAWLLVAAVGKGKGKWKPFGALISHGRKGEVFLKLWPGGGKKRKRRKR